MSNQLPLPSPDPSTRSKQLRHDPRFVTPFPRWVWAAIVVVAIAISVSGALAR
jgi:hypothetical protein